MSILSPAFGNTPPSSEQRGPETQFPAVRMAKIVLLEANLEEANARTFEDVPRAEVHQGAISITQLQKTAEISPEPNPLVSSNAISLDEVRRTISRVSTPSNQVRLYNDQEAA